MLCSIQFWSSDIIFPLTQLVTPWFYFLVRQCSPAESIALRFLTISWKHNEFPTSSTQSNKLTINHRLYNHIVLNFNPHSRPFRVKLARLVEPFILWLLATARQQRDSLKLINFNNRILSAVTVRNGPLELSHPRIPFEFKPSILRGESRLKFS